MLCTKQKWVNQIIWRQFGVYYVILYARDYHVTVFYIERTFLVSLVFRPHPLL